MFSTRIIKRKVSFLVIIVLFYSIVLFITNIPNGGYCENKSFGDSRDRTYAFIGKSGFDNVVTMQEPSPVHQSGHVLREEMQRFVGRNSDFYRPTNTMITFENYVCCAPHAKELFIILTNEKGYLSVLALSLGGNSPPIINM